MRSSSHKGVKNGITGGLQTKEPQRNSSGSGASLLIVGIGPGDPIHMSLRAQQAIEQADVICGYTTYVNLVRPMITNKTVITTAMTKEVDRVWQAIETVRSGGTCALICSGDPGIYAMAGLVFQLCAKNEISIGSGPGNLSLEVVPGIPALCAGAALLGAPLMHDFCAVSLSDLLTPWAVIEKRLHAAGSADFVTVLYNPKSKKRRWQFDTARQILLKYRKPETPAGLVTSAMRENETVVLTTLENLNSSQVGMQTTVFIGNSKTFIVNHYMITPRGYDEKYNLGFDVR